MKTTQAPVPKADRDISVYSDAEKVERRALGLPACEPAPTALIKRPPRGRLVKKTPIQSAEVLNEASQYGSAFTRGLRIELPGGITHLLISGTASIGPTGETLYPGDFRAQLWRTYHNLTSLLESEGADWHDIVRTTCYLRDIERDYAEFNSVRNEFYRALGLDPFPASTGIQARICRSDLLVEIEAMAILVR
ncbi:MAG TPA: Rid family hydrolase [Verrucomicrobiae bacterium]|nr:Rid family hydrolase [Verrucomicrobiae bacterium]